MVLDPASTDQVRRRERPLEATYLYNEWLEPSGAGGFACGSIGGEIRRFRHGILWVARRPPRYRVRLVAGVEERLESPDGQVWNLTATLAGNHWEPPDLIPAFQPHPVARWTWEIPGVGHLTRDLFIPWCSQTTLLRHEFEPLPGHTGTFRLRLRLIMDRDTGQRTWPAGGNLGKVDQDIPLWVTSSGEPRPGELEPMGPLTVVHEVERDCEDDPAGVLWLAPEFAFDLTPRTPNWVALGTEGFDCASAEAIFSQEVSRRRSLTIPEMPARGLVTEDLKNRLAVAADAYLARRIDGSITLLAGYPWYTEWGRDSMIALPALCISTHKLEHARAILDHFLDYVDQGMVPNVFPEEEKGAQYNTIDATLWMFEALFRYARSSKDWDFVREHLDLLFDILHWHEKGTRYGIQVDRDGLLKGGDAETPLTWMDVRIGDSVPTPRHGKAVEVQGLWYNALMLVAESEFELGLQGQRVARLRVLAERAKSAFAASFPLPGRSYLADVVGQDEPGHLVDVLRPNMLIPYWLTFNIIPKHLRRGILRTVADQLLTPRGIRTLAPDDLNYHGIYRGNRWERDQAYHRGTSWLFLLAAYCAGVQSASYEVPELVPHIERIATNLIEHFSNEGCMDQASEIFDGDPPHTPRGGFAHATSLAAIIEVLQRIPNKTSR